MRRIFALIFGMAALVAASAQASAQSFGIYVGPPGYGYDYGNYGYSDRYRYRNADRYRYNDGVRVYGYTRRAADPDDTDTGQLRRSPGGCGTYYFWDGERCVDARRR
jgi:hypothetical protein